MCCPSGGQDLELVRKENEREVLVAARYASKVVHIAASQRRRTALQRLQELYERGIMPLADRIGLYITTRRRASCIVRRFAKSSRLHIDASYLERLIL